MFQNTSKCMDALLVIGLILMPNNIIQTLTLISLKRNTPHSEAIRPGAYKKYVKNGY